VVAVVIAIAGCGSSSSVPSSQASTGGPPAATPSSATSTSSGFNSLTLRVTGGYTADRSITNSAADAQAVLCTRASTIFTVLHSGSAVSGGGDLGSFQVSTAKFKGSGTYAFDDGSAAFAMVDIKGGQPFSEDTSGSATKTGSLIISGDGTSGSFKVSFGPGGDPATGPVDVSGTFACPELGG
jgi:hypothetical protein